ADDLRRVQPSRLRRLADDRRSARRGERAHPRAAQAPSTMDTLRLDIALPLRAFELRLDLAVGPETVALVGPSGAGKSTVLRTVAGLARPAAGRITVGGEAWFDAERRINWPPERRSVGLVFQEYALFPHLSVRDNVAYGGRQRVDELLE